MSTASLPSLREALASLAAHPGATPASIRADPTAALLGAQLVAVQPASAHVVVAFDPPASLQTANGSLGGLAIYGMLDFACTCAALSVLPAARSAQNTSLTVSTMRPAPAGRYRARAEIVRAGRSLVYVQAFLYLHDQPDAVATASAILMAL